MRIKPLIQACLVALFLTDGDSGQAAIDTYFHMDGIPADGNQIADHTNETLVNSFSWSVATNAPGQPAFTFTLQKYVARIVPTGSPAAPQHYRVTNRPAGHRPFRQTRFIH